MKKRVLIDLAEIKNEELLLYAAEPVAIGEMKPVGQILVDSDQLSFIYLAEQDGDYTYITIPDSVWTSVKTALDANFEAYAVHGEYRLHLQGFKEEMDYVVENIKGNSNYGEKMVDRVEAVF
ncbi:hypothetical protein [Bacillus sp. FJAT-27251]|uniref:UPF0738 family protein n=1 Tax=Bacillus sp. FJAT-27251 TaxID=1684142 RepID=UPI0006A7CC50|nr:hypothetical protein [Bacillus sp. FJAT-27251]